MSISFFFLFFSFEHKADNDLINSMQDQVSNLPLHTLQYRHWMWGGLWSRQNHYIIFCIDTWLLKMQKYILLSLYIKRLYLKLWILTTLLII